MQVNYTYRNVDEFAGFVFIGVMFFKEQSNKLYLFMTSGVLNIALLSYKDGKKLGSHAQEVNLHGNLWSYVFLQRIQSYNEIHFIGFTVFARV